MKTIGKDEALGLLSEAVEDRGPEFIYRTPVGLEACVNWHGSRHNGVPGCIVGWTVYAAIADEMGRATAADFMLDNIDGDAHTLTQRVNVSDRIGVDFTEEARQLLRFAQIGQDQGRSWGAVLQAAKENVNDARSMSDSHHYWYQVAEDLEAEKVQNG